MTAITLLEDYRQNKFKDTLFETVADISWGLEFSSILLETRQGLETVINEWIKYCEQYFMLTEAEAMSDEQADAVINQFLARRTIPRSNLDTLHNKVTSASSTKPSSGMMAKFKSMAPKFLALIQKSLQKFLSKINQKTTYPPVDDAIQAIIGRIEEKTASSPLSFYIKKLLQGILAIAKKGGWLASAALIVIGVAQTFLGLPFLGTASIVISSIAVAARIIADLAAGKSLAYTMGKAAALWGLGYGVKQVFDLVWPLVQQAESLPVPPIPPEVRAGASSTPQDFDPPELAYTDSSQGEIPDETDARAWQRFGIARLEAALADLEAEILGADEPTRATAERLRARLVGNLADLKAELAAMDDLPPTDSSQGEIPGDALADPTTRAYATNWRLDPDPQAADAYGEVDDDIIGQYPVKPGETLGGIAQKHKLTTQELWDANKDTISDPDKIRAGQILNIPRDSNLSPDSIWKPYAGKFRR